MVPIFLELDHCTRENRVDLEFEQGSNQFLTSSVPKLLNRRWKSCKDVSESLTSAPRTRVCDQIGVRRKGHCSGRRASRFFGQIAQLVEHRIENPGVRGSIPRLPINEKTGFPRNSGTLFSLNTAMNVAQMRSFRISACDSGVGRKKNAKGR